VAERPSLQIRTVNMDCADPATMAAFYGRLLGWEITLRDDYPPTYPLPPRLRGEKEFAKVIWGAWRSCHTRHTLASGNVRLPARKLDKLSADMLTRRKHENCRSTNLKCTHPNLRRRDSSRQL
jgi:hypothetical protein